jgi:hypothetical protein
MIDVSRRTLPQSNCGRVLHPERDGRLRKGEEARKTLIKAAIELMAKGNFRPSGKEISLRAGMHPSAACRVFRSVDLMMRVIAREHWQFVSLLLPFEKAGPPANYRDAVWAVLVGRPRDLS